MQVIDKDIQDVIEAEEASTIEDAVELQRELLAGLMAEPAGPIYRRPFGAEPRPWSGPVEPY